MGDFFPHLEVSASESLGAVLFLFWSSSFMETLAPSARMGSVEGLRPPALPSIVFSFKGFGQGAVWSIFSNTGFSKPSTRGAEHRINFAFVSQSWSKSELSKITSKQMRDSMFGQKIPYLFGGAVTAQAHVLGDFRTLYLRSEE